MYEPCMLPFFLHGLTSVFYSTPFYNRDCAAMWKMGGIAIEGELANYM